MSPGPLWEPQGMGADPWRAARAFFAAGFRRGDIVLNALAYHLTPGGFILDEGARALGCNVFPAGPGNSETLGEAVAALRITGYSGTPDFLKVILDKAAETGASTASLTKALVSGGALFPAQRQDYAARGISVRQAYATADLGVVAYESEPADGFVVNEDIVVEIVRPGADDALPDGEVGEVVVTSLNPAYPLVRFGTGDLSAALPGLSACGRTNMRLKGWLGRADQRTKVKGMFVDPAQVARVLKAHPEVARARLVVTREGDQDAMTLRVEPRGPGAALGLERIAETLRAITNLRGAVETAAPGSLPNDGKVIEDRRDYA
jgi:phenylacetate-CoA ligase